MKPIHRKEILDFVTYGEQRDRIRTEIKELKKPRRIHVGDNLTFLFENTDTIRYQVQEMVRAEKIIKEADIQHEVDTYNELLGGKGELGCTLMIEIDNQEERIVKLRKWLPLTEHLYLKLEDGTKVRATYDSRQVGEDRISSVQYLKFNTKGKTPATIGSDFPELKVETELNESQIQALEQDLKSDL